MARPKSPLEYKLGRLNRVIDLVEAGLDQHLVLDDLAREAAFSPFHFHRLFQHCYGETPRDFLRRRRLEHGASLLHYSPKPITSIAARCGFNTADGFARAFRQHFGVTPVSWRDGGYSDWRASRYPTPLLRSHDAQFGVRVLNFPETAVAYFRRTGPYGEAAGEQWASLEAWVRTHKLGSAARFGIGLDNPAVTPPDRCRYDVCVALPPGFRPPPHTPIKKLQGGRYAALNYDGPPTESAAAWLWLLERWLPSTGFVLDQLFTFEYYAPDTPTPTADRQACQLFLALSPPGRQ